MSPQMKILCTFCIIIIAAGIYASYLSWTCNTKQAVTIGWKIFYAIGAFFNHIGYILNYYVFKRNTLDSCEKKNCK